MTDSTQVLNPGLILLDVTPGDTPESVIRAMAAQAQAAGRADDADGLAADALAREGKSATGVPGGVAIPHCRTAHVEVPTIVFARLSSPVDFGSADGPADLVFMICAPEGGGKAHLKILSKLARSLVKEAFRTSLREAATAEDVTARVLEVLADKPKADAAAAPAEASTPATQSADQQANVTRVVAITACPTGIAHTYMAADSLAQAAEARDDVVITVETQGSSGITPLPKATIEAADAVIFATDVGVKDRDRFVGKPVIESGVKRAINEPNVMLDEAIAAAKNPNARTVKATGQGSSAESAEEGQGLSFGKRIQQALMTGVSYMIPFVAAGGLLIALGFLFGGAQIVNVNKDVVLNYSLWHLPGNTFSLEDGSSLTIDRAPLLLYLGSVFSLIGQQGMGFIVAALSGYIAYALAGRTGIAPGFIGGAVSVVIGAGFLGGLITGLVAGFVSLWFTTFKVPRWLAGLMPVVIIPLCSSLITGGLMLLVLGRPIASLMNWLTSQLNSMTGSSAILLGIILGLMMCFDLGGPINKAAYLFGTAGLSEASAGSYKIMAAVMITGMVPPLALALATALRPKLFTEAERENGKAAWLLGASFISEGAIPFAAADPLRIIPATMLGGAVTGAISMAMGVELQAPHGGIFVLFAVHGILGFIISLVVGTVVAAAAVIALKTFWKKSTPVQEQKAAQAA